MLVLTHSSSIVNAATSSARRTIPKAFSSSYRVPPLKSSSREPEESDRVFESHCLRPAPPITWYPGHIAKAERELSEYLKKVDVVIEVRDARIPLSTAHPLVPEWVGSKPLIVAIARIDQISRKALDAWKKHYAVNALHECRPNAKVFYIDGKLGAGVIMLKKEALKAGVAINERREKMGIQPRAVRAAVIGFPNVGKSALINRMIGKKIAVSRNLAGVTRSLQWVRLGGDEGTGDRDIELLDSPGIIPARQLDQEGAMKLAICNDIGEASYERSAAAAAMCDLVVKLHHHQRGYVDMKRICERYELPFDELTGEEIIYEVAQKYYRGNATSAADKLLADFRKGFLGYCSLEAPGMIEREREEKERIRGDRERMRDVKIAQELALKRDSYLKGKYVVGSHLFDRFEDGVKKERKLVSLDSRQGDYEGW